MFKRKLFVLSFLICCAFSFEGRADILEWNYQYPSALELAKKSGKPILIDFQASWCAPCRQMEKEVWTDQRLVEQSRKFVCISIDVDRNQEIANQYQIKALPTIVFADPWGNKLTKNEGYTTAVFLKEIMTALPGNFSELREWNEILADDDKHPEALYQIGEFYRRNNLPDLSLQYLKQALKTKGAENDKQIREKIFIGTGLTYIKWKKYKEAQKTFEQCLKEIADGPQADKALLGIIVSQLYSGKTGDAEKTLETLKTRFPNSSSVKMAEQNIERAKQK